MNKTIFWMLAFFAVLVRPVLAQTDTLSSEISLKTYLERNEVPLNKEIVYHVELSWPGDLGRFQISEIGDPVITNLTLRGSGSSNKLKTDSNGKPLSIRRVTYYFNPVELGMAFIDGLTIQYTDNLLNKSETLFAQRISVKITEAEEETKNEFMPGTLLFWGLPIAFLIMVLYFVFRYLQRRNKVQDAEIEIKSIEEQYLDLLKETVRISESTSKESIASLKKIISGYIGDKYSIPGNVDLNIVNDRLNKLGAEEEFIAKIETLFAKAELAQFAAEPVEAAELHLFYDSIEHILNKINIKEKNNSGE